MDQQQVKPSPNHHALDDLKPKTPRTIPGIGHFSELIPPNPNYRYFQHENHPFAPEIGRFQMRTAWWLAESAILAYCDPIKIEEHIYELDFEEVLFFSTPKTDTQCFVAYDEKYVIIAFRGTEFISFKEWLGNFRTIATQWPNGGKVHTGFQNALNEIWENTDLVRILTQLRDEPGKARTFWFTGHSLGGAIATLAADRFYHASHGKREEEFIGLYTYGSPRVGNRRFRTDFFLKTVFRFANNRDMVPRIPLFSMGYVHVGTFKYINRKGQIYEKAPGLLRRWWDKFYSPFWGRSEDENRNYFLTLIIYILLEPIIDHAPLHYAHRIWNCNCHKP